MRHGIDRLNTLSPLEMIIDIILFLWRILASYFSFLLSSFISWRRIANRSDRVTVNLYQNTQIFWHIIFIVLKNTEITIGMFCFLCKSKCNINFLTHYNWSKRNLKQRPRAISHEIVSLPTCRNLAVQS